MKKYLKLIRVKHYIKNLLIFIPLIFSQNFLQTNILTKTIIGFAIFCLCTSVVYIFNDIKDVENDKKHPSKNLRPLATGEISKKQAIIILSFLLIIIVVLSILFLRNNINSIMFIITYIAMNILYSIKLKNIPIVDVTIVALGFLIRVLYGASIINVEISNWLYLTILTISFYMAMGKRRNEIMVNDIKSREVLKHYNPNFLNENMYMFLSLTIVFYSLWTLEMSESFKDIIYTIPLVIIIALKYSLSIEAKNDGDPVEIIVGDKILLALLTLFAIIILLILY